MRKELIEIVCCPDDKEVLELRDAQEDEHEDVVTGKLHCPECGFDFPIEDGIPNLLPKEFHVKGQAGGKKAGQGKRPSAKGAKTSAAGTGSGGAKPGGKGKDAEATADAAATADDSEE